MAEIYVKKFGGTSVDDYQEVQKNIESTRQGDTPIAVVSAFSGQTDVLFSIAREFLTKPMTPVELARKMVDEIVIPLAESSKIVDDTDNESLLHVAAEVLEQVINEVFTLQQTITKDTSPEQKTRIQNSITDRIISIGEILASKTLARIFTTRSKIGKVYEAVDLTDIIPADGEVMTGEPLYVLLQKGIGAKVNAVLERGNTPILPGHIRIAGGIAEIFDRGYTDTTAALTAAAMAQLQAGKESDERDHVTLEIWKEVPGLLSGDPRLLEPDYAARKPRKLADFQKVQLRPRVSRSEAAELTGFGTMKAVNAHAIDVITRAFKSHSNDDFNVFVRNTFEPELPGSQIVPDATTTETGVRFIAGRKGLCVITMRSISLATRRGWNAKIYAECDQAGVSVISTMGSIETTSFSIASDEPGRAKLLAALRPLGLSTAEDTKAMVCCIGNGMGQKVGALAEMSTVLAQAGVNVLYPDGDPDTNTIFIIEDRDFTKAVTALHDHFVAKQ